MWCTCYPSSVSQVKVPRRGALRPASGFPDVFFVYFALVELNTFLETPQCPEHGSVKEFHLDGSGSRTRLKKLAGIF